MKLLVWDTSAKVGAIAAIQWDEHSKSGWSGVRLIGEWTLDVDSQHSERLLWGIHEMLQSARWTLKDLDVFGVGIGPGSFTGLRIGVTTARTLAHTLNKPLIAVSSLSALARPAALWLSEPKLSKKSKTILVAAKDAAKGEIFGIWGNSKSFLDCVIKADGDFPGLWKRGVEEEVLPPDDLIRALKKKMKEKMSDGGTTSDSQWAVVGEAARRYPDLWKKLPEKKRVEIPAAFSEHVQGRYLAQLAWESFQAGVLRKPLLVHPRYMRAADAELKLKQGLLPPGPTRGGSS
jgi:tRNA threonylcarbamoyl adenosine modification protein YeaZ